MADSTGARAWDLLGNSLRELDQLSSFQRSTLPLLWGRWLAAKKDTSGLAIINGMTRKTIARNRLISQRAQSVIESLTSAGVHCFLFKGTALLGRCLPEQGLRAIADIDVWIRPSHRALASSALGSRLPSPRKRVHAHSVRDERGLEIDVHYVPSHLFAQRMASAHEREALFDRSWRRAESGVLSLCELIYFSTLNPLYRHRPGSVRSNFALIELHEILHLHPDGEVLVKQMIQMAIEDQSVSVLVEHLSWLGPGASRILDECLVAAQKSVKEPIKSGLALIQSSNACNAEGSWYAENVRMLAHARQEFPSRRVSVAWFFIIRTWDRLGRHPHLLLVKLVQPRVWRLFFGNFGHIRRDRQASQVSHGEPA